MGLPGVYVNVLDGNLNLQSGSAEDVLLWLSCSLNGTVNTLGSYGNSTAMKSQLLGGRLYEAAGYSLQVSGGVVYVMPMNPSVRGGVGSVAHGGTGSGTLAVTIAPHGTVTITCTTGGALGTAAFTFGVTDPITGVTATSSPVVSASSWSSTGYRVPGTYCTVVFTAGTYISGGSADIYTISTLGVVAHPQGAGPAVPTFTASPVDDYTPRIAITTGGANGTMQFTYCLDFNASGALGVTSTATSSAILSPGGGAYAIPGTGLVLTFSGTQTANDTFDFNAAGPSFSSTDLAAALTALETTYLSQMGNVGMVVVDGGTTSASSWATQVATLQTAKLALFNSGVFVDFFSWTPTVGTVLGNAGGTTVDSADTDSTVITQRGTMSAKDVCPCAGDDLLVSPVSGLNFRRPSMWASAARAASFEASEDIGATNDGGLVGVAGLFRDENATPGFFAAGITCHRTFSPASGTGFYATQGLMATVPTSDYYTLTNSRVVNRACTIAYAAAFPYTLAKIPTTTRNGQSGVITERKAQKIEKRIKGKMASSMVDTDPADAVGVSATVDRTHDILSDGNVPIEIGVQPFAYGKTITLNIGMTTQA